MWYFSQTPSGSWQELGQPTRDPDLYRPKPGIGAYQSLMHWALYVEDDRYGEDVPSTDALDSGSSDDDEFVEFFRRKYRFPLTNQNEQFPLQRIPPVTTTVMV
jgi:hypothetical protein